MYMYIYISYIYIHQIYHIYNMYIYIYHIYINHIYLYHIYLSQSFAHFPQTASASLASIQWPSSQIYPSHPKQHMRN